MASTSKRIGRRHRHERGAVDRSSQGGTTQFASMGQERTLRPDPPEPSRDAAAGDQVDPRYGHTHGLAEQRKGGAETVTRDTYGRGGQEPSNPEKTLDRNGAGGGPTGFGDVYGQGFGVGAGHGAESGSSGLEGSPRQRDYRGNAGVTFGATVGPDALNEDTSSDKRPDDKPTQ